MPIIKSAKKELRKSIKRHAVNKKANDSLKKIIKQTRRAISAKEEKARELLKKSLKQIDKAAQKGFIKKNARNRKKSRLHKKFNQAFAAKK
ncbi:30S ribosomal protein S20 [Candidatus Falkowbacteria bacterium CG_4_10_14_0_2_um_filter_48_10]|uniref:Small ribosomal subunit protein bS20 n=1 Tax=Candidatus Falkowbacteria bacterium CG23_combo_of_CG06-09_8_20_14_all_49_15 TaxID=1974572 RepID=A0A2G9ZM46_9BACT|nr:MAG: 30S ribosomal protein S20 [Candidatus Falkowbacteria bacterium CG23_combo_of_CG06-09_8_20_14_all_49_15]PJA09153.1 MAG: 30S ribosomal protein S20 [Candidatus Falkowbacteria bacterium CG_4_10_14_0_2_um_filter_48_10]